MKKIIQIFAKEPLNFSYQSPIDFCGVKKIVYSYSSGSLFCNFAGTGICAWRSDREDEVQNELSFDKQVCRQSLYK